jgi:hypothetical protein
MMAGFVNGSEFYMWRTLFAVAHADNIVTEEEISFMAEILNDVQFTDEQTNILKDDIVNAKNVTEMFSGVTNSEDRVRFFEFARDLVWVDGDFASEEQSVMIGLYKQHLSGTTVDELVGKITLEFEEDTYVAKDQGDSQIKSGAVGMLSAFKKRFLGK